MFMQLATCLFKHFLCYYNCMFYFEEINNKKVLKSSILNGLNHFFTTRESVIKTKEPEFEEIVENNKKDICNYLKISTDNLIHPSQTHTSHIEIAQVGKTSYPDTDGLILTNNEQAIYLNFADCTPVIIYDPIKQIGAVSHAGWRGTAGSIASKTVKKMVNEFGSNPKTLKCAIGPAISFCCYNVGEEVLQKTRATVKNFEGLFEIREGNIFIDLKGINKQQLIESGVKPTNIDICPYCTVCDNNLFFSYRKENATTNRHSAVIKLINK